MNDYYCVFFVNKGYILSVDIQHAYDTVSKLQSAIQDHTDVRPSEQVLLISGGLNLESDRKVSHYAGAGTLTNPVFLFQRSSRSDRDDTSADLADLKRTVEEVIAQAERVDPTPTRLLLDLPNHARKCKETAMSTIHMCARLVQEHQLLNQGWLALVSNMDDSIARLNKRATRFQAHLTKVTQLRSKANQLLQDFDTVLAQLKNIPLPIQLLPSRMDASTRGTSLLDWISATDPNSSIQELVEQVKQQFDKFGDSDTKKVTDHLNNVVEQSRSREYREITGINKRLTQLDHSLRSVEENNKEVIDCVAFITSTPDNLDHEKAKELVAEQRARMATIIQQMRAMVSTADLIHKSKLEVLENVKKRLNGWIVQAFEKLHQASREILVFEEKFMGLKQRLDLVKQIREAPVIYATAVTEIIRRSAFQKEFLMWHAMHADKSGVVSQDEQHIRGEFAAKLERHFLRVLFPGMFDELPTFYVKTLTKFDQNMPHIDATYLRELRKNVPELENLLRVTSPQLFVRLSVRDPNMPISSMQSGLRREDSFMTPDPSNNLALLKNTFPSSNWLSEDNIDMSPCEPATIRIAHSPSRFGSQASLATAPSLQALQQLDVAPLDDIVPSSSSVKSAPIFIPASTPRDPNKDSRFSSPDDKYNMDERKSELGFQVDDISVRSQTIEALKPVAAELVYLSTELSTMRSELSMFRDTLAQESGECMHKVCSQIARLAQLGRETADTNEKLSAEVRELSASKCAAEEELARVKAELAEKTAEAERLKKEAAEKDESISRLEEEKLLHEKVVKETRDEVFKNLTIEYELLKDQLVQEHCQVVEEKEEKVRSMQREMDKRAAELDKLRADPDEERRKAVQAEARIDLEREFKGKIELISKGLEQKKEDALARLRKEMEFEAKKAHTQLQRAVKWVTVERDRLREALSSSDSAAAADIGKLVQQQAEQEENAPLCIRIAIGCQTDATAFEPMAMMPAHVGGGGGGEAAVTSAASGAMMVASVFGVGDMSESRFFAEGGEVASSDDLAGMAASRVQSPEEVASSPWDDATLRPSSSAESAEMSVQTRLTHRSLSMMVSIQDIERGSTVLVIYDDRHSAYILFCNSPYLHFVKESSVRRLGLSSAIQAGGGAAVGGASSPDIVPRRNWLLGKVTNVDLCVIKKPDNRYRLPVDTRVYRVDVSAVPIEMSARP